jgi:hypothetical protein
VAVAGHVVTVVVKDIVGVTVEVAVVRARVYTVVVAVPELAGMTVLWIY